MLSFTVSANFLKHVNALSSSSFTAYERPSFEWCLWKAITEHHEELTGRGFPDAKDARSISIVGRIAAIVDRFDNMLFVGAMGTFDFDSAVEELRCSAGALDKRLINVFLSDVEALREYTADIYETEKNKPAPDTYGIKLEYRARYKVGEKAVAIGNPLGMELLNFLKILMILASAELKHLL